MCADQRHRTMLAFSIPKSLSICMWAWWIYARCCARTQHRQADTWDPAHCTASCRPLKECTVHCDSSMQYSSHCNRVVLSPPQLEAADDCTFHVQQNACNTSCDQQLLLQLERQDMSCWRCTPGNMTSASGNQSVIWPRVCPGVSNTRISRLPSFQVSPSAKARSIPGIRSSSALGPTICAAYRCFNSSFPPT